LNFPENDATRFPRGYSRFPDNAFHEILSKGDLDYGMQLHNINKWEITISLTLRMADGAVSRNGAGMEICRGVRDGQRNICMSTGRSRAIPSLRGFHGKEHGIRRMHRKASRCIKPILERGD